MDRGSMVLLLLAVTLAAAGSLGACGSDNGGQRLSGATASELNSTLDRVEQDVDAGNCEAATTQARTLVERVGGLPDSVDAKLRGALVDSADRLQMLVSERCSTASTGPTGPAPSRTSETGPTGPTAKQKKQEKQKKSEKGKAKGPKHGQTGPTGPDQTGTTGGDGPDNQDSGGAAP